MTSTFARTLVALPLILTVMTGAAMSQSRGGGGGGGNGDGGGSDGGLLPLTCTVGGACNPQFPPFYKLSNTKTSSDCTELRRPIPGTARAAVVYRCPQPN
jgi:hypothetical protein